jgi:transcriptional regulator with XRE-family HTH domain
MKTRERELARHLRRSEDLPLNEIARRVGVSKSSVSHWVRDVELTPQQQEVLRQGNPAYNRQLLGTRNNAAKRRAERLAYQDQGRGCARNGSRLHVAGCMLYWAEGARHRNTVRFVNSDPEMVRFFVRFLRECFDIPDEQIRVTCNLFADHFQRRWEIEQFWLDITDLPRSCLCKSTVNMYSKHSQKKRRNKLPFGTCRIAVSRTRLVQSIYGSIQEYAGFDRPGWLE